MPGNRFQFIKPMLLFDATWKEGDFVAITHEDVFDDLRPFVERGDVSEPSRFPHQSPPLGGPSLVSPAEIVGLPLDIWGIPWSSLPDNVWSTRYIRFDGASFALAYVRLQVTVTGGLPGDSILFFISPVGNSVSIATVHVEVIGEGSTTAGQITARRSSAVESQFVDWYNLKRSKDLPSFVYNLKNSVIVRLLGLMKTPGIKVRARCTLLGGFLDVETV